MFLQSYIFQCIKDGLGVLIEMITCLQNIFICYDAYLLKIKVGNKTWKINTNVRNL